jgi:FKBP-type peptidyl-prolyl cis-trans isomerase FkpA
MYKGKEKQMPPFFKKGTMLKYDVKLEKITDKAELEKMQRERAEEQNASNELRKNEEPKALAKYLEDNKITAKPTASGLYYIETKKGSGPKAKQGDVVKVNYSGRLIDGRVFDTNIPEIAKSSGIYDERRPYQPADLAFGEIIKGMEEGLTMMNAGSKGTMIIPSSIGYGDRNGGPIPAYSTLIFDVEVISISAKK